MNLRNFIVAAAATLTATHAAPAVAADDIQTGWAAWFNTSKLTDRYSLTSDVQLRSTDDWEHVRTVLARAGVTRAWRPGIALGAGAAYIETVNVGAPNLTEHRLWQQAVFTSASGPRTLMQRLRLEQRFIERVGRSDAYSTRVRYSARLVVPFGAGANGKPPYYAALQNEVMLNVTGAESLNGRLVDQNRAYAGIGWRLAPKLDLEFGYLNQYVVGRSRDTSNHAIQTAVYTRF
jgi:hypothetical protein